MSKKTSKKRQDFTTTKQYKEYLKRSRASKEVWKKRKGSEKRVKAYILANTPLPIRGLVKKPKKSKGDYKVLAEFYKSLSEAEAATRGFVDDKDVAFLHKDMSIALMPSRLRHMGIVTEAMEKQLKLAGNKGERALKKQVKEYANYFGVSLREVYTLFFSP